MSATNITDYDPATGLSETTLVECHDRGAMDRACRIGGGTSCFDCADIVPATGATAGIPGTWTPPGSQPPATLVDLMSGVPNTVIASPSSAWTAGQFVQTRTAGAAGRGTWTGSAWVGGVAPGVLENIAWYTIEQIKTWVDENDALADEALAAETARGDDRRTTLITWLEGFIAARDEEEGP